LDALALEEEEESTSYLSDLNKVPDFVDEPPVEIAEVRYLLCLEIEADVLARSLSNPKQ
jgi:hypothetical protein